MNDSTKCYLLAAILAADNIPDAVITDAMSTLGKCRPWAPYRSLRDWQAAQPPD
jgi:hypothetical protein